MLKSTSDLLFSWWKPKRVVSHGPLAGAVWSPKMILSLALYLKSSPRHGVSGGCEPMLLLPVRRLSFHHKTLADAINRAVNGRMFISDIIPCAWVEFYQKFYRKLDKRGIGVAEHNAKGFKPLALWCFGSTTLPLRL